MSEIDDVNVWINEIHESLKTHQPDDRSAFSVEKAATSGRRLARKRPTTSQEHGWLVSEHKAGQLTDGKFVIATLPAGGLKVVILDPAKLAIDTDGESTFRLVDDLHALRRKDENLYNAVREIVKAAYAAQQFLF